MTTPKVPRCAYHIGRPMELVGTIDRTIYSGKKKVSGYRYRCPVEKCPCVQTVLLEQPEKPTNSRYPKEIKQSSWPIDLVHGRHTGRKVTLY